ncbi:MAG: signal recognition particle-docking protein FtsY [Limnochordia bacterium]|jgi:fused signal recognition particle receptor
MIWKKFWPQGQEERKTEGERETASPSLFQKLRTGLQKTRDALTGSIGGVLGRYTKIDEDLLEELEEILIQADVGIETTMELIDWLREECQRERITDPQQIQPLLMGRMKEILRENYQPLAHGDGLTTYLLVGVNGSGKTTTCGKLAARLQREGKKVLLGAADTFRAAAIEQLTTWSERSGADLIKHQAGADPAAVAYDAAEAAKARGADYLLIDTAGRLQTKVNLMAELSKIERVLERSLGNKPQETLLVVDGTTGQNAISQAKRFKEAVDLSGVVLTKLDGTAKGGIVLAIAAELELPVKLIGIGEGIDDLRDFEPDSFVEAIFAENS